MDNLSLAEVIAIIEKWKAYYAEREARHKSENNNYSELVATGSILACEALIFDIRNAALVKEADALIARYKKEIA